LCRGNDEKINHGSLNICIGEADCADTGYMQL
jgi:hypothetical protein